MLSYILGPFLAFLPKRWRELLPFHASIDWKPAVLLSGTLECLVALIALVYWYSYSVAHWAADAVFSAIQNGAEINPNAIGFAGLAVMFLHPLTWFIAYFGFEGIVRLCAAFTDTTLGVLPLFLLDKAYLQFLRGENPLSAGKENFSQSHLVSGIRAVRERALMAALPWFRMNSVLNKRFGRDSGNPFMPREARLDSSTSRASRRQLLPARNLLARQPTASLHLRAAKIIRRCSRPHRSHLLSRANPYPRGTLNHDDFTPRKPDYPMLAENCAEPYTVGLGVRRSFSAPV